MKQPKFDKRHRKTIAAAVSKEARLCPLTRAELRRLKTLMGDMLAKDDPGFDRSKFEEACEP